MWHCNRLITVKTMLELWLLVLLVLDGMTSYALQLRSNIIERPRVESRNCGQFNPDKSMRDWDETENIQFPWMAVISEHGSTINYRCGGSLIHPNVILTSAQCAQGKKPLDLRVTAGCWFSSNIDENWPHQERKVSDIIIHYHYDPMVFHNDLALLVLSSPFVLSDNVNTVCLPDPNQTFDDSQCYSNDFVAITREYFIARIAKTKFHPMALNLARLKVINRDACEGSIRETALGKYYKLPSSLICAYDEDKQAFCDSHEGTPLICLLPGGSNRSVHVGTFSWTTMCNKRGVPGIYGNVASARLWIDRRMEDLGFDKLSYVNDVRRKNMLHFTPPSLKPRSCGLNHPEEIGSLVGWNHSPENHFPWIVAISKNNAMTDYYCAGSLIHPKVVLTAAQCVKGHNFWNLRVSAGRWAIDNATGNWPHQDRDVSGIIIHENYSRFNFSDDFALILVSRPFVLADNVNTVCLPPPNATFEGSRSFTNNYVSLVREYSIAKFHRTEFHQIIVEVPEIEIGRRDVCEKYIRETPLGKNYSFPSSLICASDVERKTSCDSIGSPLVGHLAGSKNRFVQIGIFSWTTICTKKGAPGMYGNVAAARSWIDRTMESIGLDFLYYVGPDEYRN